MIKQVNVGIIGCGLVAGHHAKAYLANPLARLVAVADNRKQVAKEFAQKYGADPHFDYADLLERDDVEAVSICVPDSMHCQITVDAAKAGKHVLCEKPMCLTVREADMMIEACKRSGVKLMIGFTTRFSLPFRDAKDLIDDGAVGDVIAMSTSRWGASRSIAEAPEWKRVGPILIYDRLTYGVDQIRWMTGSEVEKIYVEADAMIYKNLRKKSGNTFIDLAKATMRLNSGAICTSEESYEPSFGYYERITVLGSNGFIEADPFRHSMITLFSEKTSKTPKWYEGLAYPRGWSWPDLVRMPWRQKIVGAYVEELRHFVDCVITGSEPLVTGQDGKANVKVLQAAIKSMKTGKPVTVSKD